MACDDFRRHGDRPTSDLGGVLGGQDFGRCRKRPQRQTIRRVGGDLDRDMVVGEGQAQRDGRIAVVGCEEIGKNEDRAPKAGFVHGGEARSFR